MVDALCSGRSACKGVMVRIHSWALKMRAEKESEERWLSPFSFSLAPALFLRSFSNPSYPHFSYTINFGFYFSDMFPYENLDVYKKAYAANQVVYRFLKGNKSIPAYAKDQLGRASLSITLNIAEGSAKFSSKDRRNFYVTARGSTFECAALVNFLLDEGEIQLETRLELNSQYEEISRMLFTMIKNLE